MGDSHIHVASITRRSRSQPRPSRTASHDPQVGFAPHRSTCSPGCAFVITANDVYTTRTFVYHLHVDLCVPFPRHSYRPVAQGAHYPIPCQFVSSLDDTSCCDPSSSFCVAEAVSFTYRSFVLLPAGKHACFYPVRAPSPSHCTNGDDGQASSSRRPTSRREIARAQQAQQVGHHCKGIGRQVACVRVATFASIPCGSCITASNGCSGRFGSRCS